MLEIKSKGLSTKQNITGSSALIPEKEMDIFLAFLLSKNITDEKTMVEIIQSYNYICEKYSTKKSYGLG